MAYVGPRANQRGSPHQLLELHDREVIGAPHALPHGRGRHAVPAHDVNLGLMPRAGIVALPATDVAESKPSSPRTYLRQIHWPHISSNTGPMYSDMWPSTAASALAVMPRSIVRRCGMTNLYQNRKRLSEMWYVARLPPPSMETSLLTNSRRCSSFR